MYNNSKKFKNLVSGVQKMEPELLDNFIQYWSIRKSYSLNSASLIKERKNSDSNVWLKLIESNHRFREMFGEEVAQTLIKIIEEGESKKKRDPLDL